MPEQPENAPDNIVRQFHRSATRFYLANIIVLLLLAAILFAGSRLNFYREAFIGVSLAFLLWIFNANRLLTCPKCRARLRSSEGLIRMPRACQQCGVKLRASR
ncbi:MAG: hypothetical protein KJP25_05365 [Gammaproteobacteria bacterium]|nr:hypothetical protein [Gammaproteobacteria bacterium]MBT8152166.1 hypothetical protein [Gammaproteobacteria bacterium]NND39691.1 hypothetical protein [Pseudomonadales bacterium]NNL10145.1 hypothetical protein [Pseudomonadales bacterium]RZV52171.1 MAG: hypothetical protein EX270_09745 [Pseudomonadales bacterium]